MTRTVTAHIDMRVTIDYDSNCDDAEQRVICHSPYTPDPFIEPSELLGKTIIGVSLVRGRLVWELQDALTVSSK